MRCISCVLALALVLPAHAQDDEHVPLLRVPKLAPWMTGAELLRKLNAPKENTSAEDYIKGVYDATERRDWCYHAPFPYVPAPAKPRPAELAASIRAALRAMPRHQLNSNAADLLRTIWQNKWVCPTDGCCYE